jgi:hypothetical protein
MKLSAKTGVALAITALSLVVTVGAGASDSVEPVDAWVIHWGSYDEEGASTFVTPLPTSPAHVGMMNQLRNLTEPNAIKWGWSQGLANDRALAQTS